MSDPSPETHRGPAWPTADDAAEEPLFVLGSDYLYLNSAAARLLGRDPAETHTLPDPMVLVAPDARDEARRKAAALLAAAPDAATSGLCRLPLLVPGPDGGETALTVRAAWKRVCSPGGPLLVGGLSTRSTRDSESVEEAATPPEAPPEPAAGSSPENVWFQALAENTSAAIVIMRDVFLYVNPAFEELTGYDREELFRMEPLGVVHPDYRELMGRRFSERLDGAEVPTRYETVLITRDGEERWVDYVGVRITLGGKPAVLGTAFDITDRKNAELALRASEERLTLAQQGAGVVTWDWNLLTDELQFSDTGLGCLGLDRVDPLTSTAEFHRSHVHPEDQDRVLAEVRSVIRGKDEYDIEHRCVDCGGTVRWMAQRGRAIRDETGWVVRIIGVSIDTTERKQAEIALREQSERLRLMVEQVPAILWTTDRDLRFSSIMGSGLARLGLKPQAVVGMTLAQYFAPTGEATRAYEAHREALEGKSVSFEHVWGGNIYQSHAEPLRDAEGRVVGTVGVGLDVTPHRRAEEALQREREQAQVTLDSIDDGVIRTDASGRIDYMNSVAERLTGVLLGEARGRRLAAVYQVIDEASGKPLLDPVERVLREGRPIMLPGHRKLLARDGGEFVIRDSASPIRSPGGELRGAVLAFKDISAVRDMEREMDFLANHDGLTGLLNRSAFEQQLTQALDDARKEGRPLSLLQVEIGQLKVINDTCGHLAGDEMLKRMTRRLRTWAADDHRLARVGADEFAILLTRTDADEALRRAGELRDLSRDFAFTWQDRSFDVQAQVGVVTAGPGDSASSLLIAADIACMLAKEEGRGSIHEYQADDEALSERYREMHWIHRIYRALDEGRFRLYCQPIQPLGDELAKKGLLGEVLIRMVDEDGELVLPRTFLPAAERYRVISSIDRWVIARSFELLAGGVTLGGRSVETLAINLSGESLGDAAFLDYVLEQLDASGVEPRRVLFEITETVAIANLERAMRFIAALQERGVLFVLDDFGSGLSSFAYLANLPVDYLKIAGEFLRSIENRPMNRTLVRSIHQIGEELGLKTIAEGVETEEIYRLLEEIGIHYAQGFWIARPVPLVPFGGEEG